MLNIKNLEPGNKYILWFEIKGKAKTNDDTMKKLVLKILKNAYRLKDKIELESFHYSPDYANRQELGVKIYVKPNVSEKGLSALPLVAIGVSTLSGILLGGIGSLLAAKKIEKITPALKEVKGTTQWIVIGIISVLLIPTLLNIISPKKN